MDTHEYGFVIFLIGFFLFYGVLRYKRNAPPGRSKSKKEFIAALVGFAIEMVGVYMYDKFDSVMLVLGIINLIAVIWAGIDFFLFPKTTSEST